MMKARYLKILLSCITAVFLISSAAIGITAFTQPTPITIPDASKVNVTFSDTSPISSVVSIDPTAPAWQLDLRQPLHDTPVPAATPKPTAPRQTLNLTLHGVIIEPGHSYAVFANNRGETLLKNVGDTIEGATIQTITNTGATVLFNGQIVTFAHKPENQP